MHRFIAIALMLLCWGCDEDAPPRPSSPPALPPKPARQTSATSTATSSAALPATSSSSEAPPSPAASATTRDLDQSCPPAPADAPPLDIKQFALTSKLEKRQPTDELTIIQPDTKVLAYVVVNNVTPVERCVLITFVVNGKKRSSLTLDIGTSPTWRTWAQLTPSKADAPGNVEVEVTDDHGRQRFKQKLLIEPSR